MYRGVFYNLEWKFRKRSFTKNARTSEAIQKFWFQLRWEWWQWSCKRYVVLQFHDDFSSCERKSSVPPRPLETRTV